MRVSIVRDITKREGVGEQKEKSKEKSTQHQNIESVCGLTEGVAHATALKTILLVEDDSLFLELACELLKRLGYHVLPASSPGEAISLAQAHADEIDLLLTDVVMPVMNGHDLAQNLLSEYPDLKCMFMSGYPGNIIKQQGIADEMVNFIQKPFTINELSFKIRKVFQ